MLNKKVITTILIFSLLATTALIVYANGSTWQREYDGETYDIPVEISQSISKEGKTYNLNFPILEHKGLVVYGDHKSVSQSSSRDLKDGEWRYLGLTVYGQPFSNMDFPNDADSKRNPWEKSWIIKPWEKLDADYSLWNDNPDASKWLDKMTKEWDSFNNGDVLVDYFIIQSAPSTFAPGSSRGYHRTASGKVYYQTFIIPPLEKVEIKPTTPNIVPSFTLSESKIYKVPGVYYCKEDENGVKGEHFDITNTTKINGLKWKDWISNNPNYDVEFTWIFDFDTTLDPDLSKEGGKVECLDETEEYINLKVTLTKTGYEDSKSTKEKVKVIKEVLYQEISETKPTAILVIHPGEIVDVGKKFTADASKSVSPGTKVINYKWFIEGEEKPELEGKEKIELSKESSGVISVRVIVYDVNGASDDEEKEVTIMEKPIPNVPIEAKVVVPDKTWEGVPFEIYNRSKIDGRSWSSWLMKNPDFNIDVDWGIESDAVKKVRDIRTKLDESGGEVMIGEIVDGEFGIAKIQITVRITR